MISASLMMIGWFGGAMSMNILAISADNSSIEIGITQSQDGRFLYVRCYGWPGDVLQLEGINAREDGQVMLLSEGVQQRVAWRNEENAIVLSDLTSFRSIGGEVWVFRIEGGFVEASSAARSVARRRIDDDSSDLAPGDSPLTAPSMGSNFNIGASVSPIESAWSAWTTDDH
jgi:hypothetical protein